MDSKCVCGTITTHRRFFPVLYNNKNYQRWQHHQVINSLVKKIVSLVSKKIFGGCVLLHSSDIRYYGYYGYYISKQPFVESNIIFNGL